MSLLGSYKRCSLEQQVSMLNDHMDVTVGDDGSSLDNCQHHQQHRESVYIRRKRPRTNRIPYLFSIHNISNNININNNSGCYNNSTTFINVTTQNQHLVVYNTTRSIYEVTTRLKFKSFVFVVVVITILLVNITPTIWLPSVIQLVSSFSSLRNYNHQQHPCWKRTYYNTNRQCQQLLSLTSLKVTRTIVIGNVDVRRRSVITFMNSDNNYTDFMEQNINKSACMTEVENTDVADIPLVTLPTSTVINTNTNRGSNSSQNNNGNKYQRQRLIPPTEIEIQRLKQIRQEAYERICGPSSIIDYNDDNETNNIIIVDTGATYNASKDILNGTDHVTTTAVISTINDASDTFVPLTSIQTTIGIIENLTSPIPSSTLNNIYITLDTAINSTTASTNITSSNGSVIMPTTIQKINNKKKKNVASIWSFESLFPEPVWDVESIEKDLYRNTNRTNNLTSTTILDTPKSVSYNNIAKTTSSKNDSLRTIIPTFTQQQQLPNSITKPSSSSTKMNSFSNPATFLYGGSGVVRKERPQQYSSYVNATASTNITGKVDPRLTRMVEDRVYGYRRLPTGVLQYETSLVSPDSAIQFRNGVRLGNPLPINADILSYLAKKELQRGRVEEACELYERAINIDPSDGRAYLGLSKCAERRRDFTLARKWLVQGINRSVSVQQQRSSGGSNNSKKNGNGSNNMKNDQEDSNYEETIAIVPDRGANPFLLQALGCLEEKLGRLTQAEALYAEAVKSRPYHTAAWVSLAVLRTRKLGYSVRAGRECYQCAERELQIAKQPPSAFVYTSWANLEYSKANDKNRARELFQKAIEIDPRCSAALLQLGVLEVACQNWDAAEQCFEAVLKFDQRNTRVLQAYAIMETKRPLGDSRKAIGLFERAIQTNPRDAGIYQPYALYVAQLGDLNVARSLFQKGTQVNKRHAAVWQAWGVFETRYGDADTARNIFQEGIWSCGQLSGSQSGGYQCDRLWQAWGVLEANEGQYAEARRCFSRALDANNRNVPALTAWAQMEERIGNVKDARMIFERGLRYFSSGSEDKRALYRSYELMEQRLGETTAAQNIYQRSVRESFTEKDEIDVLKSSVILTSRSIEESSNVGDTSTPTTPTKKKTKEFEVVRWENSGGEVWLNDRAIEAKVSMNKKAQQPLSRSTSTTSTTTTTRTEIKNDKSSGTKNNQEQ